MLLQTSKQMQKLLRMLHVVRISISCNIAFYLNTSQKLEEFINNLKQLKEQVVEKHARVAEEGQTTLWEN